MPTRPAPATAAGSYPTPKPAPGVCTATGGLAPDATWRLIQLPTWLRLIHDVKRPRRIVYFTGPVRTQA